MRTTVLGKTQITPAVNVQVWITPMNNATHTLALVGHPGAGGLNVLVKMGVKHLVVVGPKPGQGSARLTQKPVPQTNSRLKAASALENLKLPQSATHTSVQNGLNGVIGVSAPHLVEGVGFKQEREHARKTSASAMVPGSSLKTAASVKEMKLASSPATKFCAQTGLRGLHGKNAQRLAAVEPGAGSEIAWSMKTTATKPKWGKTLLVCALEMKNKLGSATKSFVRVGNSGNHGAVAASVVEKVLC
jgi:hypothetical protein